MYDTVFLIHCTLYSVHCTGTGFTGIANQQADERNVLERKITSLEKKGEELQGIIDNKEIDIKVLYLSYNLAQYSLMLQEFYDNNPHFWSRV